MARTLDQMIKSLEIVQDEVRQANWRTGGRVTHVNLPVVVVDELKELLEELRERR